MTHRSYSVLSSGTRHLTANCWPFPLHLLYHFHFLLEGRWFQVVSAIGLAMVGLPAAVVGLQSGILARLPLHTRFRQHGGGFSLQTTGNSHTNIASCSFSRGRPPNHHLVETSLPYSPGTSTTSGSVLHLLGPGLQILFLSSLQLGLLRSTWLTWLPSRNFAGR